jgi:fluoride exporter
MGVCLQPALPAVSGYRLYRWLVGWSKRSVALTPLERATTALHLWTAKQALLAGHLCYRQDRVSFDLRAANNTTEVIANAVSCHDSCVSSRQQSVEGTLSSVSMSSADGYPWQLVLLSAGGGAVGSAVRMVVSLALPSWVCDDGCGARYYELPLATLVVNLAGSFILGLLSRVSSLHGWKPEIAAAVGSGFCGGLTTYSTFAVDEIKLLASRNVGSAFLYFFVTTVGCLTVCFLGWCLGSIVPGQPFSLAMMAPLPSVSVDTQAGMQPEES